MSTPPPSASTTSFLLDNRSKCSDPCSPIRALELTRLLLGQFRKGEANDPEIWIRSMVLVLSEYSEPVVIKVTDPRTGLARKSQFLPTICDIVRACNALAAGRRRLLTDDDYPMARRVNPEVVVGFQHLKAQLVEGNGGGASGHAR
jgi:hypothetical protein